jgi:hypothetical protein
LNKLFNKLKKIPLRALLLILFLAGLLPFYGIYKFFDKDIKTNNFVILGKYSFIIIIIIYGLVFIDLIKNIYKNNDDKYYGGKIFLLIVLWFIILHFSD